jgi:radical SAM superfamily enzyme YgiQ (UPF0313 family)
VPKKVLAKPEVDCVALGEAEVSLCDFLRACEAGNAFSLPKAPVQGMVFKQSGATVGEFGIGPAPDLDALPWPDKAPFYSAFKGSDHEYRIMTSRGCPCSCSYCFNSHWNQLRGDRRVRQRSIDNVIAELRWAKQQFPVKYVLFMDDSFTTSRDWILAFCRRYKEEIGLPFACIANPRLVDREMLETLHDAGAWNMQIGVQHISNRICAEVLHRVSDAAAIGRTLDDLRDIGIMVQVDHMLGIPGDSIEMQEESVRFYNRHRPSLISILWLTYYPKTTIIETAVEQGLLTDDDLAKIDDGIRLTSESYLSGGSMRNPGPYYSISFLMNYLPLLPRFVVSFLLRTRLYRVFAVKNFVVSTAVPRAIQSVFNRRDFRGRSYLVRFLDKAFLKPLKRLRA